MPKPNYQCIRCGYETPRKDLIRKHFYKTVKNCPACKNNIELTDEIKEHILLNRIYIIEKPIKTENSFQLINNYNYINKFINKMETPEKLDYLLDYKNLNLLDYEDKLDQSFEAKNKRLENTTYKAPYILSLDNIIEIVNKVTKIEQNKIEEFSLLFDKKVGRIKIYRGKSWESFIEDMGIKELISLIKSYFLDNYELYLIKQLHSDYAVVSNRILIKEHLEIYYKFIAIFTLTPFILGMTDKEILGHSIKDSTEHYLEETYLQIYYDQKKSTKESEQNKVKKKITKVVKENTINNLSELDQLLLEILKIDEPFREKLFETRKIK